MLRLLSEFVDNEINKEFFVEILDTLIQKQRVIRSCYGNRTCLSLPKENQTNTAKTNDKDNLKEDS